MKDSHIEWTHHTFNPWWGCTKVSPGCTHCYADTLSTRWGHKIWGPKAERRFFGEKHWQEPLKWNAEAEATGERRRVFCASMADVFERHMLPNVQSQLTLARSRLWCLIEETPHLDWLLLTKRPEHICEMVPVRWLHEPPHNIWYGTSVENQEYANTRIPELLKVPAVVRFLSCEPLLGPVRLADGWLYDYAWGRQHCAGNFVDWVIAGGESGPGARPMHPDWARSLRDQCQAAGVAFFMKQWGEWQPCKRPPHGAVFTTLCPLNEPTTHGFEVPCKAHACFIKAGKKVAGRLLDGRTWDEFPTVEVDA